MKKFLVVLLSLGLLVAFGATAWAAADVKFGGSYYVVGLYNNNPTGTETGYSKALFYQRVRLQPVFAIAEGLTFTARMDALEKQWGQTDYKGGYDDLTATRGNAATKVPKRGVQESFEFERAYVTFNTKVGVFQIGYQNVDDWGTDFGDYSNTRPRIAFATKLGPVTLNATYEKVFEADTSSQVNATLTYPGKVDADNDTYALSAIYNGKGVEAGLLYKYYAFNSNKIVGFKTKMTQVSPYAKLTFGPVYVEGEATYWFGKTAEYEAPAAVGTQDVDLSAWSAYLKGQMNMGPAFFGALFAYVGGNDLSDATKNKVPPSGGGTNFAPALILMNDALNTWTGGTTTANVSGLVTTSKYNIVLYNVFGGFSPTPALKLEAALTYATVAKKSLTATTEAVSDKLGTEFDVKATYKIYDNLSYMVGAGYLWTGDYFKGANAAAKVDNDYLLLNQLTLSF
jgi:hypothetical protein